MVFGHESHLEHIARRRKKLGVPLKTLVLGCGPKGFGYTHLKDYTALRGLVDDLRVGCHVEIFPWGNGNDILKLWGPNLFPVSPNGKFDRTRAHSRTQEIFMHASGEFWFCRFEVPG